MRRKFLIALVTIGSTTALATLAFALVAHWQSAASSAATTKVLNVVPTMEDPDTSSPNWKQLSEDVGVMIRKDDRLGLRGRLYVRVDGSWKPVATDGSGDTHGSIPAR